MTLALPPSHAQDDLICEAQPQRQLAGEFSTAAASGDAQIIEFEAGQVEASLGDQPAASLTGGVLIRRGDRLAGADTAVYDPGSQSLVLQGDVRFEDPDTEVTGDSAEFNYESGRVRFDGARFLLGESNSRGAAEMLEISQEGVISLEQVSYTTCPPESDDWLIEADVIELDTTEGLGRAKGVKLRFMGVPILYTPRFSFPLGNARKSGILPPVIGSAGRSGNEIAVPVYWNIAENYDATITPRLLTARGVQVNSEFRYLTVRNDGIANVEYLANDSVIDRNRYLLAYRHRTLFDNGWRNVIDFREVSDNQYFEDLGFTLSTASTTHLDRHLLFDFHADDWSVLGRVQDYQTIDEAIAPEDEPYRRVPQLYLLGSWPDQPLGLSYGFEGELVNFDREVGVTGWRLDLAPQIELPVEKPGWFFTPGVILQHTRYDLQNTDPGQADDQRRTLPIGSVDTGMMLERRMTSATDRILTLEPRVLYVHVPFREQDSLPVFDTIVPDLNLVQLYRKNRFLGVDRIADTDQLSVGVTSRILDVGSGRELMTATVGQALYLSESGVTLPGQPVVSGDASDYIAELRFLLLKYVNFDIGHQWGADGSRTSRSEVRFQFRPANDKILNLAYRYRRDSLEQADVSWSWPLAQKWNFVGRYNFSLRDQEPLEELFGVEYESCCWGVRIVSRRHLSTRDGTRDTSVGLQLVLKGMSSVGTSAETMLEQGIRGYTSTLN